MLYDVLFILLEIAACVVFVAIILGVFFILVKSSPPSRCSICELQIKRSYHTWNIDGVKQYLCPKCNRRYEEKVSREAFKKKIEEDKAVTQRKSPEPETEPATPDPKLVRVAANGQDLGNMTIDEVRKRINEGSLLISDYYYDFESEQWFELSLHAELVDLT